MIARAWNSFGRTTRFISEHPLTRDHRGAALLRYFTWQLRRRFTRQPKVIRFVNDSRLEIPPGAHGLTGFHYVGLPDFEDALQAASAKACGADWIVTRDEQGFRNCPVPAIVPAEFLARFPLPPA